MFDLVETVGNSFLEILGESFSLNDFHYTFDLSSDWRSRRLALDTNIDVLTSTIEINLNYRSEPKMVINSNK